MSNPLRVLVVEDEAELAAVIVSYFEREGYIVDQALDGPSAVQKARLSPPDLIILDVMLPGFDGIEVCRQVRTFSDAYILMLTARDEEVDKVVGFAVGADDYVVKPFSPRELIARSRAILRRPRSKSNETDEDPLSSIFLYESVTLNSNSRTVMVDSVPVELTRTEFDLLEILMEHPKNVFSRKSLLESVRGGEWFGEVHVVDVHIGHLRKKLTDAGAVKELIRTVRGVGYGMGLK
jgi:DNA-binding response OmpR family regulator